MAEKKGTRAGFHRKCSGKEGGRDRLFFGREGNARRFSEKTFTVGAEPGFVNPENTDELRREFIDRFLHGGVFHLENLVQDAVGQFLSGIGQEDIHFAPFAGDWLKLDEATCFPVLDNSIQRGARDAPFVAYLLLGIRHAVRKRVEKAELAVLQVERLAADRVTAVDAVHGDHELSDLLAYLFHLLRSLSGEINAGV